MARLRHVAMILGKVLDLVGGGEVGESDNQQPAELGLGRIWWLRGIEMELVFQSNSAARRTDSDNNEISPKNTEIEIRLCFERDLIKVKD